jgi:FkbM family methyltransferase
MTPANKSILRRLLSTESEWNPKVMLSRAILPLVPERALHRFKKSYYAYIITHSPEHWIEQDAMIARHLISPGDTVLDIGANLGIYSRFLSRCVGPTGKVYAFEPIPQIFDFLTNNLRKLGLKNVEALDFALSDTDRTDTMVIPTYRWGSESWYDAQFKTEKVDPIWRTVEVRARTLDSFFSERPHKRISFLKCDANFHELAVLKGALRTIQESLPAMVIEVLPDPDDPATKAHATFEFLRSAGFDAYCFDGKSLVARKPGQRGQNYFFLTQQQARTLGSAEPALLKSA